MDMTAQKNALKARDRAWLVVLGCLAIPSWGCAVAPVEETGATEQAIVNGQVAGGAFGNVGALIVELQGVKQVICSGTLIAPTIFLTASHCTAPFPRHGITDAWVTFDPAFVPGATLIRGTAHTNPAYIADRNVQSDPHDVAVVVLDQAPPGIVPARLPYLGQLDDAAYQNGLNGQVFTAAGYGVFERTTGGGPADYVADGTRRFAHEDFRAINDAWLHLSQNASTGDGGGCDYDSGGPNFLGALDDSGADSVIAAITVTGDYVCRATSVPYRLDTDSARSFLGQFVALP